MAKSTLNEASSMSHLEKINLPKVKNSKSKKVLSKKSPLLTGKEKLIRKVNTILVFFSLLTFLDASWLSNDC